MKKFSIAYQNYDIVVKEAFSIFNNCTLDFLGLDLAPIQHLLNVELPEITARESKVDLVFLLADGSILHLECEVNISLDDLIRFARYDLQLFSIYKKTIHTVILSLNKTLEKISSFHTGSVSYDVKIHQLALLDGELVLSKIKNQINLGKEFNPLELIFLPLMKQHQSVEETLMEVINLEKIVQLDKMSKEKLIASSLVVVDKLIDRKRLEEMWEELKMYKIFEIAEEKGIERGIKKGIERGIERGMEKGLKKGLYEGQVKILMTILSSKFRDLPRDYELKLRQLSTEQLELISKKIFELRSPKDLDNYL